MTRVLLVDPALAGVRRSFQERLPADVDVAAVATFDDAELAASAAEATVFVDARRRIDASTIALAPRLRLIQMIGVGVDPVDLDAARAAGITVAYNPGVNRVGAAEQVLMIILALLKRLPLSERATRAGRFDPGEIIAAGIDDLASATVGLIGMGHIGSAVAERIAPFGSRIVYYARRPVPGVEQRTGAHWLPLADLLASATVVSLHVPLTPETHHLIGAAELASMPRGAYLINAGRGGLVHEAALRDALVSGHLAGAGLDVLEHETLGRNPFADLPQVIVTPHVGGGSRGSMSNVVDRSTSNIRRFLAGQPLQDVLA